MAPSDPSNRVAPSVLRVSAFAKSFTPSIEPLTVMSPLVLISWVFDDRVQLLRTSTGL